MLYTNNSNVRKSKLPLRAFSIFIIIVLVAVGATWWCSKQYYNKATVTANIILGLDSSLNEGNKFLKGYNKNLSSDIRYKFKETGINAKLTSWVFMADSVLNFTNEICKSLEEVKQEVLNADSKSDDWIEKNLSCTQQKKLYNSLQTYASDLINLVPSDIREKLPSLPIQKLITSLKEADKNEWVSHYFTVAGEPAIISLFTKVESDVIISGNILMQYIDDQLESGLYICEFPMPLVVQNAMVFLPGQTLEVTAGLGYFNCSFNSTITIGNQIISSNEEQMYVYKKRITNSKGGSIPVTVSFKDPNTGEMKRLSKKIYYKVLQ